MLLPTADEPDDACAQTHARPDVGKLRTYTPPAAAFAVLVQLMVGPSEGEGEQSFDVLVCSPPGRWGYNPRIRGADAAGDRSGGRRALLRGPVLGNDDAEHPTVPAVIEYRPFPKLTVEFVSARFQPGWRDIAWAARNQWLGLDALAALADALAGEDDEIRALIAIAALDHDDRRMRALLDERAAVDAASEDAVEERWLDVALAWLYHHRQLFEDPLSAVEDIWEAFGHFASMTDLIRWMPATRGQGVGGEAMMDRWRARVNRR